MDKSTPTVPVYDVARGINTLKARLIHYRNCSDSRCKARAEIAKNLIKKISVKKVEN